MRSPLILVLPAALAGCSANPTGWVEWPVTVAPAAGRPERLVAVPPECGPVPAAVHDLHGTSWHDPHLGLGCATARSIAVQAEQPRDLLAGRTGTPDAEREARAVDQYRKGEEKDLMRAGTTSTLGGGAK